MPENEPFRLFVYGTLKRGFPARERFLARAEASEAEVNGNIYALDAGYPAITVAKEEIRATGSGEIEHDLLRQSDVSNGEPKLTDEPLVHGEIVEIRDIETVREIDEYEGFDPDRPDDGLYRRVLISARKTDAQRESLLVWAYAMDAPRGATLPDGRWSAP